MYDTSLYFGEKAQGHPVKVVGIEDVSWGSQTLFISSPPPHQ